MANYIGGSAPAMVRQVADGFTLVSEPILKRFTVHELDTVIFELDKLLRETRAEFVDLEDLQALQKRNRKLSRMTNALRVLRNYKQKKARGRA